MSWSRSFRNFIRRHTAPKTEQEAIYWTDKLSSIYVFCAWNAMGFAVAGCLYKYKMARVDEQKPSREQVALERTLTWGNFTARIVHPPVQEEKIEAIETES
ncbi:unnamed protein product [Ceutorhynchus assimilis]|uniref:Uncharacterized protein n=1 Tax=Ceutorhynchus assimilis TaxID=467358 RepID=A0A9N9QI42_9CUCU|nr:unnamed protein product [Ceutorhynchus assimilis]